MKKTGIIATIIAIMLLLIVSASATIIDISLTPLDAVEDTTYTGTITVTSDKTITAYELLTKPTGMTISPTGVITWTPDEEQIGSHTVTVKATDEDGSNQETFTIFARPQSVCEDYEGTVSNIRMSSITIESDNDDEDDFYPGDTINIEVDVENEDNDEINDVVVEVLLYDTTEGKTLDRTKSKDFDLDDYDSHTVKLTLEVPKDIDSSNDIILFISAYEDGNDNENCDWESDDGLNIKRRNHDIVINEVTLIPEIVKAGKNVEFTIGVENVGARDEEGAYITIKNDELKIDKKSEKFDIESYEHGDDDEHTVTIIVSIPANAAAGVYDFEIYAYDENKDLTESGEAFATLTVEGTNPTTPTTAGTATITIEGVAEEIKELGKPISIPVKLTNTASEAKEYKILLTNIADWAESTSVIDAYLTPEQTSTFYLTLVPKTDATEGQHSATVNVKEGTTTITTKTLSFTIPEKDDSITGGTVIEVEDKGAFQNIFSGTTFWIIGDLVLVIVGIFFIRMLFSKKETD